MIASGKGSFIRRATPTPDFVFAHSSSLGKTLGYVKLPAGNYRGAGSGFVAPIKALEPSRTSYINGKADKRPDFQHSGPSLDDDVLINAQRDVLESGKKSPGVSSFGNSTNILWHRCSVGKSDRQQLLQQKGCVVWITGLSGSGKSTLACALSHCLHAREKLTYVLDGDNVRHGLNSDLSFRAGDRVENIRRIGEVAKLFADAGVICIASLISPYRKDRDACRALLQEGEFIEVFMDVPLHVCEARDPKGLYKLARAGKIKGFTGIDDPYEPPQNAEIVLHQKVGLCDSPADLAETVVLYLQEKGYLVA